MSRFFRASLARKTRTLLQVKIVEGDEKATAKSVERLMGTKAEARFEFIPSAARPARGYGFRGRRTVVFVARVYVPSAACA